MTIIAAMTFIFSATSEKLITYKVVIQQVVIHYCTFYINMFKKQNGSAHFEQTVTIVKISAKIQNKVTLRYYSPYVFITMKTNYNISSTF